MELLLTAALLALVGWLRRRDPMARPPVPPAEMRSPPSAKSASAESESDDLWGCGCAMLVAMLLVDGGLLWLAWRAGWFTD
ncbi:hypothetical protein [Tuwongella immobilis]|uniref:hypothetical protein n=1 Tax=Tuwongella immobilis TaxID=692036 RepID=UPI001E632C8E|nr:hypothetical protein [Tuwongella immobilis]